MDYLGSTVIKHDGTEFETRTLCGEGKVIGILFSASWCPPCRVFNPILKEFYKRFKESSRADELEIVFVSSDKSQEQFDTYFSTVPWLAIPYADRDLKKKLCKKFKVKAIPCLVLVDSTTGQLITRQGRESVNEDPEGKAFPWPQKKLDDILSGTVLYQKKSIDLKDRIKDSVVGFYFSAHWCPPCRAFTPTLIQAYETLKAAGKKFEVVFVSSDRSESSFDEYVNSMPWLSFPYKDKRIHDLSRYFGVSGIPSFILLSESREIITKNGRGVISKDPDAQEFPWPEKPLVPLNDVYASRLNECCCLIYFTDGNASVISRAKELMQPVAEAYIAEMKTSDIEELVFMFEDHDGEDFAESLRNFAQLSESPELLALVDIPEQKVYEVPASTTLSSEVVTSLVEKFKAGTLETRDLEVDTS